MVEVIKETVRTARKEYSCDASEWIVNADSIAVLFDDAKFSFADKRKVVNAMNEGWKIFKGTKYIEQIGKYEGDIYRVRGRIDMVEICKKYDLYVE